MPVSVISSGLQSYSFVQAFLTSSTSPSHFNSTQFCLLCDIITAFFISKLTFYLSAFPCFLTCCQLTKTQKAEKYRSRLLLEYNLVHNCSAFLAFFFSFFKLFLPFPGPMMTSFFKVDTELFLLIAFRLFQGFSGLHKPKKAKCHTSDVGDDEAPYFVLRFFHTEFGSRFCLFYVNLHLQS